MVKSQNRNPINIKRIGGYLHKAVPVLDGTGKIINYSLKPLMVEFHFRDLMQIIVGSFILAIPIAFTEEVWHLSEELPLKNIIFLSLTSLFFISFFIYFNFYKTRLKFYKIEFSKRVLATYLVSALAVAGFLTLIDKCPWGADNLLAIKRIILVSFPASMSATISDILK